MAATIRTKDGKNLTSAQYDKLRRLVDRGSALGGASQQTLVALERRGYAEKAYSHIDIYRWTPTAAGRAVIEARRR